MASCDDTEHVGSPTSPTCDTSAEASQGIPISKETPAEGPSCEVEQAEAASAAPSLPLPSTPLGSKMRSKTSPCLESPPEAKQTKDILWAPPALRGQRWEFVNEQLKELPLVESLSERMQVAPVVVGASFLGLALLFVLYGIGGQIVCTIVGVAYPAFQSFKAVESFANLKDSDMLYQKATGMQFWLTYWIVYATITTMEAALYYILVAMPFYYLFKLIFILCLYLPIMRGRRGATRIYDWFIHPYLKRNEHIVDRMLEENGRRMKQGVEKAAVKVKDVGIDVSQHSIVTLGKCVRAIGPGLNTLRKSVGSEIARRRAQTQSEPEKPSDENLEQ
eukprot:TRINITY_DN11605_c0_g1_i1.p1 TRINITY_DN11605_c0_g1~~TRINITY_DN11605_c0_g1_i1.p1  ORF type:complete len:334 (+),score=63.22 TRINITY_DN11605_c0_g1_i1:45-1046(+)